MATVVSPRTAPLLRPKPKHMGMIPTYSLAHTAQCKLKIHAGRADRNLRFVLGHAFTLDNLMLRIVEIENQAPQSQFGEGIKTPGQEGEFHFDCTKPAPVDEHFDCTKAAPAPEPEPEPEHFDCTKDAPEPEPEPRGRRISFQDNNARPSVNPFANAGATETHSNNASPSPARKRSPPPKHLPLDSDDDDGTSSDDYEEPSTYAPISKTAHEKPKHREPPVHDAYSDEEDAALELADDEDDGLSLQRFESASAHPPRMVPDDSSDEDDDGPASPPTLPADVDVRELMQGEADEGMVELYESVRRCRCHGERDHVGGRPDAMWDVPEEKTGGKKLAIMRFDGTVEA